MFEQIASIAAGLTLGLLAVSYYFQIRTYNLVVRLNAHFNVLLKHQHIDIQQLAVQHAHDLRKAGKKIEAIQVYRDITGAGLAEAKAFVDDLPPV